MSLTAKEEKFCQVYVRKLSKAKAAVAAGYSKKSAKEIGYENLTKPHIIQRVAQIREEIKEELGIDEHSILTELNALAKWNMKDFILKDNAVRDLSKMSKLKLIPVTGVKTRKTVTKLKDIVTEVTESEFKFADKRAALIDLGRHLGIFEKDNVQKVVKIKVTRK